MLTGTKFGMRFNGRNEENWRTWRVRISLYSYENIVPVHYDRVSFSVSRCWPVLFAPWLQFILISFHVFPWGAIKFRGHAKKNEVCDVEIIALRPPGSI